MKNAEITGTRLPFSREQKEVVLGTLRRVLDSPHFSKSKRYPAFLEYIVLAGLEDHPDALKERTVGIEVFDRPADYDTSTDPVVRIAAGEVRRRMAVYFSEHPETPVWFDIPAGSYKAEIHFRHQAGVAASAGEAQSQNTERALERNARVTKPGQEAPATVAPEQKRTQYWRSQTFRVTAGALFLLFVAGGAWWHVRQQTRGLRDFWWPVVESGQQSLVLVGRTAIPEAAGIKQATLSLDDVIVTGQICSILREYKSDCIVRPGESENVGDVIGKPIVVVGGFNNPWSSRILAPLPYQLENRPTPQADQSNTRLVVEHLPTGENVLGEINHNDDANLERDKDYAIVARFHSDITQSMAVVIAGLGRPGTGSAEQFISSPESMKEIAARAPKGWSGGNFEAVLGVDLIQGNAGHIEVIAARYW